MQFRFPTIATILALLTSSTTAQSSNLDVPVPWSITSISITNTRHGTGGTWSFNILDSPTLPLQGLNTTCSYYANTYSFALDGPVPYNAPCSNPNVTFGFFPNNGVFTFNVTHVYVCGKTAPCHDNGTWTFSWDDVRGQEQDVRNNFGQSGYFSQPAISMYPRRDVQSYKCEFC